MLKHKDVTKEMARNFCSDVLGGFKGRVCRDTEALAEEMGLSERDFGIYLNVALLNGYVMPLDDEYGFDFDAEYLQH